LGVAFFFLATSTVTVANSPDPRIFTVGGRRKHRDFEAVPLIGDAVLTARVPIRLRHRIDNAGSFS
jgi:hypothetical protein